MSDQETPTPAKPARKFIFNGMNLPDLDATMTADQVRDVWAGTYPELANAKVKGPEKDKEGAEVFTFVHNVGKLG